jgi:hypothetical protein
MEEMSVAKSGGKMTTHLAFSLVTDPVWWAPLRSPGAPWSFMELAAVRSDILGWTGSGAVKGILCGKRLGNGFGYRARS